MTKDEPYLILCKVRGATGALLWWRPNRSGYTVVLDDAGRYSRAEAERLQRNRPKLDVAVPLRVAEKFARRIVSDEFVYEVLAAAREEGLDADS